MTREEYIKHLIGMKNQNMKDFSKNIAIPYTTLLGMLKNGLGGASVDNVIKVCRGLEISIDDLQNIENNNKMVMPFYVTEKEKLLLTKYRKMLQMQPAVDAILGIGEKSD